jgi:hypothetical protein
MPSCEHLVIFSSFTNATPTTGPEGATRISIVLYLRSTLDNGTLFFLSLLVLQTVLCIVP